MTLTDLSYYIRKYTPLAIIVFLILTIFYFMLRLLFIYSSLHKKPIKKNIRYKIIFSKLERPKVKDRVEKTNFKYILDNIEGKPVTATQAAEVFLVPPIRTKLSFREKLYSMATTLGFDVDLTKKFNYINSTTVEFKTNNKDLKVDVQTFNFSYTFDYKGNEDLFSADYLPSEDKIKNKAIDFLSSLNKYPEALSKGEKKIIHLHIDPQSNAIKVVDRVLDANAVEVDFYRGDIPHKIVSPKYFTSQNYVVFSFSSNSLFPIKAQVKFFPISTSEVGIYPIKTGNDAWKTLTENKAIVVAAPLDRKTIVIEDMFMAYLDPDLYQRYIQPVYVFIGRENFVAFVPAVVDNYLAN